MISESGSVGRNVDFLVLIYRLQGEKMKTYGLRYLWIFVLNIKIPNSK